MLTLKDFKAAELLNIPLRTRGGSKVTALIVGDTTIVGKVLSRTQTNTCEDSIYVRGLSWTANGKSVSEYSDPSSMDLVGYWNEDGSERFENSIEPRDSSEEQGRK